MQQSTNMDTDNEYLRQRQQHRDDANDTETVTLTREEYDKLKSLETTAQKYDTFKTIVIWGVFILFVIAITVVIRTNISENEVNGVKLYNYYGNDIDRVRKEVESNIGNDDLKFAKVRNNFRPGRLYHRGANYGRKE